VATNLENLEYSGNSLNLENSGNFVQLQVRIVTKKILPPDVISLVQNGVKVRLQLTLELIVLP